MSGSSFYIAVGIQPHKRTGLRRADKGQVAQHIYLIQTRLRIGFH